MKIGVLGGIGPEATGIFYTKLIKKFQENGVIKNNTDYPQIIINSIPAPELIYENISDNDLLPYVKGLKELESLKVDYIIMVCNTIHLYYDKLQKEISIPIINMKEEIKNELHNKNIESLLVLGTPNTMKSLYNFDNIKYYYLTEKEISDISKAIFDFNNGNEKKEESAFKTQNIVYTIYKKYLDEGVKNVLIACTELSALLESYEGCRTYDTLKIMVNSTYKKYFEKSD